MAELVSYNQFSLSLFSLYVVQSKAVTKGGILATFSSPLSKILRNSILERLILVNFSSKIDENIKEL